LSAKVKKDFPAKLILDIETKNQSYQQELFESPTGAPLIRKLYFDFKEFSLGI
jgi:hypothetical protein